MGSIDGYVFTTYVVVVVVVVGVWFSCSWENQHDLPLAQ